MYSIIEVIASNKDHPWHKYLNKHLGRYNFKIDLANDLISWGISMDWLDDEDKSTKPAYLWKQDALRRPRTEWKAFDLPSTPTCILSPSSDRWQMYACTSS
jgi:hypothetical protein